MPGITLEKRKREGSSLIDRSWAVITDCGLSTLKIK